MSDTTRRPAAALLTISAFADTVGLTASALRFYDDAGLLTPATVDDRTGYRYYTADQRWRATLVRQMRELDVPLTTMRAVLDGDRDQAERLLTEHADRLADRAERARSAVPGILRALRSGPDEPATTTLVVGGPELAGAIRQVAPFAADDHDGAALDCLLLDVADGELTVVGTDRYRLGARTLRLLELDGPDRRLPVAVTELIGLTGWLRRLHRVRITASPSSVIIAGADEESDSRTVTVRTDRFPDHRLVLQSITEQPGRHRMITDRTRLLELLSQDLTGTVLLRPADDEVLISRLNDPEVRRLPAVCTGAAEPVAFAPALLASALQSSVGPDVLIETAPGRAAVVRSADDGSFSTLVMPQRLGAR